MEKPTKVRWVLLGIVYVTCLVAYLDRVNLSICGPLIMQDFGFDRVQLGLTMSAFFLAYTFMQIPGGLMSEKWGLRITGTLAMFFWSIFTVLTPLARNFYGFMAVRFMFGIGEGPLFPNNGSFLAKWFSKEEKAMSSSIMVSGAFIGPALGPPLTVWLLTQWGWQMVFYAYGIAGVVMTVIWYLYSRDHPHLHPQCNETEISHITQKTATEAEVASKHEAAPWKKFLKSGQFWALGFQYCIANYIMYLFLSWLPIYLLEARGLSMKAMGIAAAYPWIAMCVALVSSGIVSDKIVKAGYSKFIARSVMALVGLAFCGIGLYLGANATTPAENIFWLSVSLGFLGFTYTAAWASCQDLGQRFGGSVVAWMNTWANIGGFLAPTVTALLVNAVGWQNTLSVTSMIIGIGVISWLFVKPDLPLHVDCLDKKEVPVTVQS